MKNPKPRTFPHFSPYSDLSPRLKIVFSAAIPEEYLPFLKKLGNKIRKTKTFFVTELSTKTLYLLPTGMGLKNLWLTHAQTIPKIRPDVIVSFGFCGGLAFCSKLDNIYLPVSMKSFPRSDYFPPLISKLPTKILYRLKETTFTPVVSISTPMYLPKHRIEKNSLNLPSIVDMETYYLAFISYKLKIPFISIRAMTDKWNEEVPFDTNEIINTKGFVSIPKVLKTILKNPNIVPHLNFYRHRAQKASNLLAKTLHQILKLPNELIRTMEHPVAKV